MADWHCYCDETCTERPDRYMALGGVLVPIEMCREIKPEILAWRQAQGMLSELKWQKVSRKKLAYYLDFVHSRLHDIEQRRLSFGALILDRHKLDYRGYSDGCDITGQSKFYYQLILHRFVPLMDEGDRLFVFPDEKRGKGGFAELQSALNNGIMRKYGRRRNTVALVKPICSKTTELGQVNDLFLGAVGYHANNKQRDLASGSHKRLLAAYIAHVLNLPELSKDTALEMKGFQVWRFALSERKKRGATHPSRRSDAS